MPQGQKRSRIERSCFLVRHRSSKKAYTIMVRKLAVSAVIVFWALMTGFFIQRHLVTERDLRASGRRVILDPEYLMGVFYGEARIGEFRFNSYPWTDNVETGYRLVSTIHLRYAPVGEAHITGESFADHSLLLKKFEYYLKYNLTMLGEQEARLEGTLQKGKLLMKVKWGTFERRFAVPAKEGISLYDPITPWIVGEKFRPGQEYTVRVLNRFTRSPQVAKVRVMGKKRILFEEAPIQVFDVETVVGDLKSTFWVGQDGKVYRMESPLGFSLVRESSAAMERHNL